MGRRMVKRSVVLERLPSISVTDLKALKFLVRNEGYRSMPISIQRSGGSANESYGMRITVSTQSGNEYIIFDMIIEGVQVSQRLELIRQPNGLGLGFYFKCGVTGKNCYKLYLFKKRFVSRLAIPNHQYLRNTLSKKKRGNYEAYKRIIKLERDMADCGRKWFQRYRWGRHTVNMKRVIRAKAELERLNRIL